MSDPTKTQLLTRMRKDHGGNDAAVQRDRILEVLQAGHSLTTLEARRDLDVLMPATRIFELREAGHAIEKIMVDANTEAGVRHRVALYYLAKPAPAAKGEA
jgi:hypothetical protein